MKKLNAFLFAFILFGISIVLIDMIDKQILSENKKSTIYNNVDEINSCEYMMEQILAENAIPVLGSSELSAADEVAYPPALFQNGNSDFNMILIGRGYMQSLHHAINAGALSDDFSERKVVLILSPQWFTEAHLSSGAYSGTFSERMYAKFLKNKKLSKTLKSDITNRVKSLLAEDAGQLGRVEKYEGIYLKHSLNPISYIEMKVYDAFMDYRQRFLYHKNLAEISENITENQNDSSKCITENIDFDKLLQEAEQAGKQACTNNEFYIYDEYFDTYIKDNLEAYKDSSIGANYSISPEYNDLRLFLNVCRETGIEPLIVNIPVNGRWYDWTGFSREDREIYYENIRSICSEYQVEMADFSNKEYEEYFLKDIMHLGWKGWVYLDDKVYQFYKKQAK